MSAALFWPTLFMGACAVGAIRWYVESRFPRRVGRGAVTRALRRARPRLLRPPGRPEALYIWRVLAAAILANTVGLPLSASVSVLLILLPVPGLLYLDDLLTGNDDERWQSRRRGAHEAIRRLLARLAPVPRPATV